MPLLNIVLSHASCLIHFIYLLGGCWGHCKQIQKEVEKAQELSLGYAWLFYISFLFGEFFTDISSHTQDK